MSADEIVAEWWDHPATPPESSLHVVLESLAVVSRDLTVLHRRSRLHDSLLTLLTVLIADCKQRSGWPQDMPPLIAELRRRPPMGDEERLRVIAYRALGGGICDGLRRSQIAAALTALWIEELES